MIQGGDFAKGKCIIIILYQNKVKVSRAKGSNGWSFSQFPLAWCMPRSIVNPPPPGQNASPSQGYPPAVCRQCPFIHVGEKMQIGVKFLV